MLLKDIKDIKDIISDNGIEQKTNLAQTPVNRSFE
jgi:hypothetical protein